MNRCDPAGLKDYSAAETQAIIAELRTEYSNKNWFQRLWKVISNHGGGGDRDYKAHLAKKARRFGMRVVYQNPDRYCLNGEWLSADEFGNFVAGYSSKYAVGGFTGDIGVRAAGGGYGLLSVFTEGKLPGILWGDDWGSVKRIVQGEIAAERYIIENGGPTGSHFPW